MERQMMRGVLERLERTGELTRCAVRVDPRFELGAVLSYYNSERPILFTNVAGSSVPVAGGLYGNRRILCDLLHTTPEGRIEKLIDAIAHPRDPVVLDRGPIQENAVTRGIDIRRMFPVPISNEKDSAPFLTAGMLICRDTVTGQIHMAVRRFQVNEGNSINVLVSPASPHLLGMLEECRRHGRDLECAVLLGYDAPLLLASQISSRKYGLDKYRVDSALRGEPLELVRCRSVDLEVPAHAEIALEGVIQPGAAGPEGPFAELMGYYSAKGVAPLMEITAVTHRNHPIFQHCFPCREEHLAYGMIKEAEAYAALSGVVDVRDVNYTLGGGCRLHAAVSIRKRSAGDGRSAILTVLGAYKDVKHVIVVDDDVDIYDPMDLEFALASRFQASTDLVVVPGALGSPLEASYFERGVADKMGFDATKPLGETAANYTRAVIPGFDRSFDIKKYIPD
jgi:2,5-furandicarboxylate decarboxylase 1